MHSIRRQSGFTVLEVTASAAMLLVLTATATEIYSRQVNARMINKAIAEVNFIGEAAQSYFIDNDEFPDAANNCAGAIAQLVASNYLGGAGVATPFGGNYVTTCPGGVRFDLSITAPSNTTAAMIAGGTPRSTRAGTTVTSNFTLPGAVPNMQAYLSRIANPSFPGNNRMLQDIDANGNRVLNVSTITASGTNALRITGTGGVDLRNAGATTVTFGNNSELKTDQGGSIELGGNNTTNGTGTAYIDLHAPGGPADYSARIQASGANNLLLTTAGTINITTPLTNVSGAITALGAVTAPDVRMASLGNFSLNKTIQYAGLVENGDKVPKPVCPAGMTQGVTFGAERMGEGPTPSSFYGWQSFATDDPSAPAANWVANLQIFTGLGPVTPAAGWGRLSAITFCY